MIFLYSTYLFYSPTFENNLRIIKPTFQCRCCRPLNTWKKTIYQLGIWNRRPYKSRKKGVEREILSPVRHPLLGIYRDLQWPYTRQPKVTPVIPSVNQDVIRLNDLDLRNSEIKKKESYSKFQGLMQT